MIHVKRAWRYARDVASAKILTNDLVRLQCERSLRWRAEARALGYRFDAKKAERAASFISVFPHTKGALARSGKPLRLEGWQCFFICMIFGWVHAKTKLRVIRRARLYVARKNGKSDLAARLGLYMLTEDGEYAPEVYCGATSEAQALEVFRPALRMTKKVAAFREYYDVEAMASSIVTHGDDGFFQRIIGKPGDGASPHCAITDEYHEHADDSQLNTMETGMGARQQPLSLVTSTAGETIGGPCYNDWLDLMSVLTGATQDDELFGLVYAADPEDDWQSEEALHKANPNFGVSVGADFLRAKQSQAVTAARKQGPFKTKHLNMWVGALDGYFNIEEWRACCDTELMLESLAGREAWIGLDLASKRDIAAMQLLIDIGGGRYACFGKHYLPEDGEFGSNAERYKGWSIDGWMTRTEGNVIDFEHIEENLNNLLSDFQVKSVGYDPSEANYFATRMLKFGAPMVEFRQSVVNMTDPMKSLDALIASGRLSHPGDPCMEWQMSNVVARENRKGQVYPNKARNENKIDGPVALIMAVGLAQVEEEDQDSVYETRGVLVI
ncbi:MAG: terminase large subunit [Sphingomonadales bacterium]